MYTHNWPNINMAKCSTQSPTVSGQSVGQSRNNSSCPAGVAKTVVPFLDDHGNHSRMLVPRVVGLYLVDEFF